MNLFGIEVAFAGKNGNGNGNGKHCEEKHLGFIRKEECQKAHNELKEAIRIQIEHLKEDNSHNYKRLEDKLDSNFNTILINLTKK